jgi:hypothetical protein
MADDRSRLKAAVRDDRPKTTAGKAVFQVAKPVADILRHIAEPPLPLTSTAQRVRFGMRCMKTTGEVRLDDMP